MNERVNSSAHLRLPDAKLLSRIAVSENGFAFDPVSGNSFTLNPTALDLFRLFQRGHSQEEIMKYITDSYDISAMEAERDIIEFAALLCESINP